MESYRLLMMESLKDSESGSRLHGACVAKKRSRRLIGRPLQRPLYDSESRYLLFCKVCTGGTGHAEAVQITYDPQAVDYKDLVSSRLDQCWDEVTPLLSQTLWCQIYTTQHEHPLQVEYFFRIHDPTTKDRQGNDRGTQYR